MFARIVLFWTQKPCHSLTGATSLKRAVCEIPREVRQVKLENKIVLVTGAGSGIGRELALLLLSKGNQVAGVDLNADALSETSRLAGSRSAGFAQFVVDITDRIAVATLPGQVIERFNGIDCVINNAGIIQPFRRVNALDMAVIERVLNVNLFGTLHIVKAFLPHLLQRREAHIVNVSSMGGLIPVPGQTIYCAAKAAVKLLTEGLASELMGTKVRATVVFPGAVATNILENSDLRQPAVAKPESGRMKPLQANEAAAIIVRGMERNADRIFVGSDVKLMDKLYRLNPTFAARMIAKKMSSLLQS